MPGAGLCNWVVQNIGWRRGGFRFPETALFQPARPGGSGVRIFIITVRTAFCSQNAVPSDTVGLHKP